jgi:hypothetical protein
VKKGTELLSVSPRSESFQLHSKVNNVEVKHFCMYESHIVGKLMVIDMALLFGGHHLQKSPNEKLFERNNHYPRDNKN